MAVGAAGVRRRWRRFSRNPFRDDVGRPTIVHCGSHKVGTVWFENVLGDVAREYGLTFVSVAWHTPRHAIAGADVVVYQHTRRFDDAVFADRTVRGSHIIRDPRDVIVSAYHYHQWTDERWVHEPREEFGGRSYQEHLKSLSPSDGLLLEIERTLEHLAEMGAWDYTRPNFLELRYEDLIADEQAHFAQLFAHYGFGDSAIARAMEIAAAHSFTSSGRQLGQAAERSHLRSGRPGEWRTAFGPEHVARFNELGRDLVVKLGYETDDASAFPG